MADVAFLAILVAFFAVAAGFVRACERIIGPDLEGETSVTDAAQSDTRRTAA